MRAHGPGHSLEEGRPQQRRCRPDGQRASTAAPRNPSGPPLVPCSAPARRRSGYSTPSAAHGQPAACTRRARPRRYRPDFAGRAAVLNPSFGTSSGGAANRRPAWDDDLHWLGPTGKIWKCRPRRRPWRPSRPPRPRNRFHRIVFGPAAPGGGPGPCRPRGRPRRPPRRCSWWCR